MTAPIITTATNATSRALAGAPPDAIAATASQTMPPSASGTPARTSETSAIATTIRQMARWPHAKQTGARESRGALQTGQ